MDSPSWYRRVLPVTALAVCLVALLAVLIPGVRDQVALSASHQPQEYVALSFARTSAGTVEPCARTGRGVLVSFTIDSELPQPRDLQYVVTVGVARRSSTVGVEPGGTTRMTEVVPRRSKAEYDVSVRLPGAEREIIAHCPGRAR